MDKILLLKWPYTFEDNKKGRISEKQIKRDYKLLLQMNTKCNGNHPLFEELFNITNNRFIPYQKLKISKDFFIKELEYIKKIREYHCNITKIQFY